MSAVHITVEPGDGEETTVGSGTTGPFPVPFPFLADTDLLVYLVNAVGQETLLTLTTDYTVTGAGEDEGGEVTLVEAIDDPISCLVRRSTARQQLSVWGRNDPFPAGATGTAFARLTMIVQELDRELERLQDELDTAELEGVDLFADHIEEGFIAVFGATVTLFYGELARWEFSTDASGNCVLAPKDSDIGNAGILALHPGGSVQAGDLAFRTEINTYAATSYNLLGGDDAARCNRFTGGGSGNVTVTIRRVADVSNDDRFFTNDWSLAQRVTTGTLTIQGNHADVVITNAYTGATGPVTVTKVGGVAMIRCTAANNYEVSGDIAQREVETATAVTSTAGAATLNWTLGNDFTITLTEDTTFASSNLPAGVMQRIRVKVTQHASSAKTGAFTGVLWPGGTPPTISVGASAVDEIVLTSYGDGVVYGTFAQAFA